MSRKTVAKAPLVPTNVDEYIAVAAPAARPLLEEIRRVVRAAAPEAEELISYRMPAFRQHGILIYFAAFKQHIGVFPPVSGDARLAQALAPYAGPKGNLKFPMDGKLPSALLRRDREAPARAGPRAGVGEARSRSAGAAPAQGRSDWNPSRI